MVKINRVYTRQGDQGQTSLVGGKAVGKADLRVEAYGTLDELSATLGGVRAEVRALMQTQPKAANQPESPLPGWPALEQALQLVQQKLFDVGGELATAPPAAGEPLPDWAQNWVGSADVIWLEEGMDALNAHLPPLQSFVLPGGSRLTAALNLARTVCRRAERLAVALAQAETVRPEVMTYLNRLSDALFVWGRWVAALGEEAEILWASGLTPTPFWE